MEKKEIWRRKKGVIEWLILFHFLQEILQFLAIQCHLVDKSNAIQEEIN